MTHTWPWGPRRHVLPPGDIRAGTIPFNPHKQALLGSRGQGSRRDPESLTTKLEWGQRCPQGWAAHSPEGFE